jgi:L-2,4-diaminobutyric acid acetyltransferase
MMIRLMKQEDFSQVHEVVRATKLLDVHTVYTYWVMTSISPELMLVADKGGEISGFIAGFGPYKESHSAFIWQLGVLPKKRGLLGLGMALLQNFHNRSQRLGFRKYVFTIAPGNNKSRRLLAKFAQHLGAVMIEVGETGTLGGKMTSEIIYNINI